MNPYISPDDPRRRPWSLDSASLLPPDMTPYSPAASAAPLAKPGMGDSVSTAGDVAALTGVKTANPYLAAGGLGLKAIGTGMEIYGAFKGQDAAEEQAELAREAYISSRMRADEEARRRREMEGLGVAGNLSRTAHDASARGTAAMATYNRAIGR